MKTLLLFMEVLAVLAALAVSMGMTAAPPDPGGAVPPATPPAAAPPGKNWFRRFVETLKNLRKAPKETGIYQPSKLLVFIAMVLVTAVVTLAAVVIITTVVGFFWVVNLTATVIVASWLIGYGIVNIPIQHAGVILLLGQRVKWMVLSEGYNWIMPEPFMRTEMVDQREQVKRIGDQNPFVITTIEAPGDERGQKPPVLVTRLVQTKARVTVTWKIDDPATFLNIGRESVENGLVDIVVKSLRQEGSLNDDIYFIRNKDTFEEKVLREIENDGVKNPGSASEDFSNQAIKRWGIKVLGVMIPKIEHNDPEVVKAYEKVTKETQKAVAEERERNLLVGSIKQLAQAGLTPQQAILAFQADRGKSQRVEIVLSGGGEAGENKPGDLTSAMAVLAAQKLLGANQERSDE